ELLLGEAEATAPSRSRLGLRLGRLPWIAAGVMTAVAAVAIWAPWRATQTVDRPLIRLDATLGADALPGSRIYISPDGTRIVFQIRSPGGTDQLATRLLDKTAITPLPGTENAYGVFFSPDSQWIGFAADNKLKKVSLRGGAPVNLADTASSQGASWGESGEIVASLDVLGGLVGIPPSGGTPRPVTQPAKQSGEYLHRAQQVLPGGDAVLFVAMTGSLSGEIQVVSLKSGAVKPLLKGATMARYIPGNAAKGPAGYLLYGAGSVLNAVAFDPVRLEIRGSPEQILDDAGNGFSIARDGTLVYRPGAGPDAKYPVVSMDNSGATETLVAGPGNYTSPQFSPNGQRLAMEADGRDIVVYDRRREVLTRIAERGGSSIWTRDGEHLAFTSASAGGSRLNWVRADGSSEPQMLLESKGIAIPGGFSPDGRRLAYAQLGSGIWTLPLDPSDPDHPKPGKAIQFLESTAIMAFPVFSPDGRYVAYHSNESGGYEVYVRPAPGPDGKPGPGKWQVSTGGGVYPVWSPNGRELFYRDPNNANALIMVADYTAPAGGAFASAKPRVWSPRPIRGVGHSLTFAMAPDGKHFAVFPLPEAAAEDKAPGHVTFLLNFLDELRRKVPAGK
ncbi:MAG TPA: hypothetical protein VKJ01_23205, partial [Candidatus Solibacter sp.]|nr:hypothetical protein [Candidatus Solibacter sp.]